MDNSIQGKEKSSDQRNNLAFIKEVAKYFMDFLETDFHKRKIPRRSIQLRNNSNLLVGLNLNKYSTFNDLVWKTVNHAFDKNASISIGKSVYRTNIPKNLVDLIKLQTEKVSTKEIDRALEKTAEEIEKTSILYAKEYDKALSACFEATSKEIKKELVLPFIENIEKPLENLNLGDENSIYLMEEELTSVLVKLLENKISKVLNLLLLKEKVNILKELKESFGTKDVKGNISSFFEDYKVNDLFSEVYEIERNRTILDKQEFYLYFCDISFSNAKFPIFYIPFSLDKQGDKLDLEFDSQIYINKKAIEFIVQGFNEENERKGSIETVTERIIYLAEHRQDLKNLLSKIINEITNYFNLDKSIDLNNPDTQIAKSSLVRVSNSCYISLFDKSDEALVNDYEEIMRLLVSGDNPLGKTFNQLIEDFIYNNPQSFNPLVEDEWDKKETSEKLVFSSPIPLNSEQLQILSAIKNDDCKYIIVEGPPGTGKSHTITAIIFDLILRNKSVLVLSDKKEALDVVEDKITEVLNKVRQDKNFQNPILRLGKTGSTYSKILSGAAIENIKNHFRAVKKDYDNLEANIDKLKNTLKEDLEAEIIANKSIDLKEVQEYFDLESYFLENGFIVDIDEVLNQNESAVELEEIRKVILSLREKLILDSDEIKNKFQILKLTNFNIEEFEKITDFQGYLKLINFFINATTKLKRIYREKLVCLSKFGSFKESDLENLVRFVSLYEKERSFLFGYHFKKKQLEKLNIDFKKIFDFIPTADPHQSLADFKNLVEIYSFAAGIKKELENKINFDFLAVIHELLKNKDSFDFFLSLEKINDDLKYFNDNLPKYPKTIEKLKIDLSKLKTYCKNELTDISDFDFDRLIRYINLDQKLKKDFRGIPEISYLAQKKNVEELVTLQMTAVMDRRLIDFYQNNLNDAITIKNIITKKTPFPKDKFDELKEAFPCILAGIRDYAEYIPLEPDLFDLIIIDEASQVSIAQAFPALLRAKKILILGDRKQFSNVKTSQARTEENRKYLNVLKDCFIDCVSSEPDKISKLDKFNIKTSILEFFEFISNYNAQLLKHFRGYKELISYSNKYFYQNLQVMKVRGKSIDDVLKFSVIPNDGKKELISNTNKPESEFIISELQKLKEIDSNQSVGIITPHTNQQKLLAELINKIPEKDYFYDKLRLKIMTFDTCQGEERDIIFYSMVATEDDDHLWGVFIKDLKDVNIEEDGQIKAQRLNVGFSRAKETMHFVLSKPIEKYNGSIGEALRHYENIINEAKKERSISEVDANSKMEPEVMNWFYQTSFWNKNKENIEFIPQFELGKYLKQLNRTYNHPKYKVDFLLVYKDEMHEDHKIIIEYDGFREHFKNIDEVNEYNYQDYYTDDDIYREKVLESYGYKFLRINKFNIGNNPVNTLNNRIGDLIKNGRNKNNLLSQVHETIEGLENGEMKECPKCKEIRLAKDFKDSSLSSGYGRFCRFCKGDKQKLVRDNSDVIIVNGEKDIPLPIANSKICSKCGAKMILRKGRYGQFFGCSRFPYCRGATPKN